MARVLMVDDDEMERVYAAEVLRWGGHEPVFARDGAAALRIYEQGGIDVVVTDLAMPHVNGLELIHRIREMDPGARIVAISGASANQLDQARAYGAAYSFMKPWDPEDLVKAIDQVVAVKGASSSDFEFDDNVWLD